MLQPGWAGLATPLSQIQHANFSTLRHDTVTQREAIKIARHLRFGAATPPLAFPARLTGLPGQWRISYVYFVPDSGVLRAESYVLTTRRAPARSGDGKAPPPGRHVTTACSPCTIAARRSERTTIKHPAMPRSG